MASTSAWFSAVPSRSSILGSSGVRGLGMEASTASAIAGSQRYCDASDGSRSADPVTAALPPPAKSFCTASDVNHSRNLTAPAVFGAPEAMPQMNVPMAGPLISFDGVRRPGVLGERRAVALEQERRLLGRVVVGHARRHVGDELEQALERAHT